MVATNTSPGSAPSTHTGPPIGLASGGHAGEAWSAGRDGEVVGRLEVARARVIGLDLEGLPRLHVEERLVAPVEGVSLGVFAWNPLHPDLSELEELPERRQDCLGVVLVQRVD